MVELDAELGLLLRNCTASTDLESLCDKALALPWVAGFEVVFLVTLVKSTLTGVG